MTTISESAKRTMSCFAEVLLKGEQIPKLPFGVDLLRGRHLVNMVGLLFLPDMEAVIPQ
jgi:hypothetical protein